MKLCDILQAKGTAVYTTGPRATLAEVVTAMVEYNCGSLVVCDRDKVVGIITESDLFRLLINTVSGIGPKIALNVLSGISVTAFRGAVANSDVKTLSQISGVGKKTAERIVVELKDKIGAAGAWEAASARPESRRASRSTRRPRTRSRPRQAVPGPRTTGPSTTGARAPGRPPGTTRIPCS